MGEYLVSQITRVFFDFISLKHSPVIEDKDSHKESSEEESSDEEEENSEAAGDDSSSVGTVDSGYVSAYSQTSLRWFDLCETCLSLSISHFFSDPQRGLCHQTRATGAEAEERSVSAL